MTWTCEPHEVDQENYWIRCIDLHDDDEWVYRTALFMQMTAQTIRVDMAWNDDGDGPALPDVILNDESVSQWGYLVGTGWQRWHEPIARPE